ncbi:MAG TPA: hypothetical protein VIK81_02420 [Patescibacteria group bacterium]
MVIEDKNRIKQIVDQSKNILVALPSNPNTDLTASALALYLSLGKNKSITVASPTLPVVEHSTLVGVDQIIQELGPRKFIITLSDVLGSVDKVTHYLEDDKLNVVVHPLPNSKGFSADQVQFSQTEPDFDLILTIGVSNLNQLEKLYTQEQSLYSNKTIISILAGNQDQDFATVSLANPNAGSNSEITALFLKELGLPFDEDIAANLYQGLEFATSHFNIERTTTETFEAAALCVKFKPRVSGQVRQREVPRQSPQRPVNADQSAGQKQPGVSQSINETQNNDEEIQPEPDWFEPKIFKSSGGSSQK